MIQIVIEDERSLFRESLKTLLMHRDKELEVVGFPTDREFCEEPMPVPDVILFILNQPYPENLEKLKGLKKANPRVKSIVMAPCFMEETFSSVLQMGVDGYVLQDITLDELVAAIKSVSQGLGVFQKQLLMRLARRNDGVQTQQNPAVIEKLTERECELIRLIAEGKSNKEIASALCIALGTVKNTISTIFDKLQSKDRTQLAIFAVRNNLVRDQSDGTATVC